MLADPLTEGLILKSFMTILFIWVSLLMITWFSGVILYTLYVLCQTLYYLIFYRIKDDDLHYVICNVNIANFG